MGIVFNVYDEGSAILARFQVHRSRNCGVCARSTMQVSKPNKYVGLGLSTVVFKFEH